MLKKVKTIKDWLRYFGCLVILCCNSYLSMHSMFCSAQRCSEVLNNGDVQCVLDTSPVVDRNGRVISHIA